LPQIACDSLGVGVGVTDACETGVAVHVGVGLTGGGLLGVAVAAGVGLGGVGAGVKPPLDCTLKSTDAFAR
jgi:hypothetical protein